MKLEHTPGPWTLEESKGGAFFIYPPGCDAEGHQQPLRPRIRIPKRGTKQMFANARLIAAAPEVLEALIELDRWACTYYRNQQPELYRKVETAIRKAKGER